MDEAQLYRFRAANGLALCLRPLRPDDGPLLADLFSHLGPESRYQRFNVPLTDPDPGWVEEGAAQMANLPPEEGRGWIALADLPDQKHACIAGIRYVIVEPGVAEVALTVRDDLQGHGIGTELLRFAARQAHAAGIRRLIGHAQSTNTSLWRSMDHLGVPVKRVVEGPLTRIEVDLRAATPSLPDSTHDH